MNTQTRQAALDRAGGEPAVSEAKGRALPALLAGGLAVSLAALLVLGGVGALLLDEQISAAPAAGVGCGGGELFAMALLGGGVLLGLAGVALSFAAGVVFWRRVGSSG